MTETKRETKPAYRAGNAGDDPKLRYTDEGRAWCGFSMAVEIPEKPGDWQGPKLTRWYDVRCFGTLAEHVAETVTKGMRVVVIGRGYTEPYVRKDGSEAVAHRIMAEALGPDLRWASAVVHRVSGNGPKPNDPNPADDEPF